MHQIVFNEISAAELSALPTGEQLDLMSTFQVDELSLQQSPHNQDFGVVEREGKKIFRFRHNDYRVYFTIEGEETVVVQRVLSANSITDFLFRSKMGAASEDQKLASSRSFWKLIEEGEQATRR
ncbi:MAG: type II toxin-antitoxin system RelE/ParE family toxin [Akkermansia sp.]